MLITLKHRGSDGSGIFIDGKFVHGSLDDNFSIPEGNFGLGHNLLSIVGSECVQPLTVDEFVLVCNGEIYNFQELERKYNLDLKSDSDCEVILALVRKFYQKSLFQALDKTIKCLDGDYAFAIFDGINLAVLRDPVGVKPVYYSLNNNKNLKAFASERKALWEIGIEDVETLMPGQVLYNWKVRKLDYRLEKILESDHLKSKFMLAKGINLKDNRLKNDLKDQLKTRLLNSVKKRLRGLSEVGIMFSAGVDSTLLARLSEDLDVDTYLYSVGHEDSVDFKFARKTAGVMGLPIHLQKVTQEDVRNYLPLVLNAIEEYNLMKLGVGMPAYIAAELAHEDGMKVMLSGQGADELFAGYHRYLELYLKQGEESENNLKKDILNLYQVNLQRDDAVSMANSVELRLPYLDLDVINIATNIPMKYKINGENDTLRKCILREIARDLKVPEENVKRPKKAAQYGSGIDKMLRRVLKDEIYRENLKNKVNFNI